MIVQCRSYLIIGPLEQTVQLGVPVDITCLYEKPIPADRFDRVSWYFYAPGHQGMKLMSSYITHTFIHREAYKGGRLVRLDESTILNETAIRLTSVEWRDEGSYQCQLRYANQPNGSSFSSSWSGGSKLFVVGKYKF